METIIPGGSDACYGDSGGGLVCDNVLVGVVSFGKSCALADYPGVYTEVQHYAAWIKENASTSSVQRTLAIGAVATTIISLALLWVR